ncbi:SGNH hydrolase [Dothidotthia symphoricarpi CBS 119687]|uniref:SGNH hydrolase n=1 Tax=Dothidotthia symphoricarpi CBS 119687 TaxID=1392245 RepID=A0A6A6ABU8_9PLEO|nr:SGNH hydrolase [Dothidotthia symphoricarpi CBS 119687]KAF2129260.1 SGNH hydrolase [Dothidotthia symphoricarpi CBS 119687]
MISSDDLPEFVLFGDSLTEWSFDDKTQGFGLFLEQQYHGKAQIVNEGQAGYYTSTDLALDFDRIITRAVSPRAPPTLLFTIFLGANDACLVADNKEYVPLSTFAANIRTFVETILTQDALSATKIVLITPPPINRPTTKWGEKSDYAYKTYVSKRRYAEKIMQIAAEYGETGRVVGLDYWGSLIDAALEVEGRGAEDQAVKYGEEKLPGCGLVGAKEFGEGWFTDGLHLDVKGYAVLSKGLMEVVVGKWPELAPERL